MKLIVLSTLMVQIVILTLFFIGTHSEQWQVGNTDNEIKISEITYDLPDITTSIIRRVETGQISGNIYLFTSVINATNENTIIAKYDSDLTNLLLMRYVFKIYEGSCKLSPLETSIFWVCNNNMELVEISPTSGAVMFRYLQTSTTTSKLFP